jgi:phage tail sheath protein FI
MPTYTAPGVYVEEVSSGSKPLSAVPTAIAAFVGFTASAPTDDPSDPEGLKPRLVTSWPDFEKLYGGFAPGCMLPLAVYGFFANGGSTAYIVRVPNSAPAGQPATKALPAADRALGAPLTITSVEPDADIEVVVEPDEDADSGDDGPRPFKLSVVEDGKVVESFSGLGLGGDNDAAKVVNGESTRIKVAVELDKDVDLSQLIDVMKPGTYPLEKAAPTPVPVTGKQFAGSESARTGINGLAIADDVTIVAVPDLVTACTKEDGSIDLGLWKAVQTSLITHCEQQANRVALLDAPPGMSPQQIKEWRSDVAMYDSSFAAMYYPWIKVENPVGTNGDREVLVPPCGHVAGLWARVDESRGVWKAPANEVVRGALDVEVEISQAEQGLLNPIGINCIRPFGTRGIRVWGARTLSSDAEWRYLNVRRLFNMVETAIMDGTQWVVFEPNDMRTWEAVKRNVGAFLTTLWRDGALFGNSREEAFYVKCDETTNPPELRDQGRLTCEVGIAPVKPAEFVVFRVSQYQPETA